MNGMDRRQFLETSIVTGAGVATGTLASMSRADTAAGALRAGVAKVDITNPDAKPQDGPLYAKALVLSAGDKTVVIVTVDAVAISEVGSIPNDYLAKVRLQLKNKLKIKPMNVIINASHCHGIVCKDIEQRTVQVVKKAWKNLVPVNVGVGIGHENRIMENRRLKLKNGREADIRRAYSLPPDEEVATIGPVDPEIGILRLDRKNGETLALVYNFACHPIQGIPSGGNTADFVGFASRVIEDNLSDGTIALFLQGCVGDVHPVQYKDVNHPRDAEPLGNMLGLSVLYASKKIKCRDHAKLCIINETIGLPRANLAKHIECMKDERKRLLKSLKGTSLNLKAFIPLYVKYNVSGEFPSYYSHRYMHEKMIGKDGLEKLDTENRRNMERYIKNIHVMEELTRLKINLLLLEMHQKQNIADGMSPINVEVVGLRIGEFVLLTFPGELSVQIGLNIKKKSPFEMTFVASVTNGYIYYAPTAEQLKNRGRAQEDSDCVLAPEWQDMFEKKADEIIRRM